MKRIYFLFIIARALVVDHVVTAQSWREVNLPPQSSYIQFAGNTTRTGALALWSQGKPFSDTSLSVWFTPAHFFTSTNFGNTWDLVDSSNFTIIDKPPLRYYDSPYDLIYVGDNIARITFISQDRDLFSYSFEHRNGNTKFIKRAYGHQNSIDEGTQNLFLTERGDMYNTYLHLNEPDDSTIFALMKSTDSGATWQIVPDSVTGMHVIPRVTSLAFRPKFPAIMYLGTVMGILRSADEGNTWQMYPTNTALDSMYIRFIHVHPKEPNLIFACGYYIYAGNNNDVLFRTTDNGLNWQQIFSDTLIRQIATSESDPRIALINTSSGLYRSTDRGASWTPAQGNLAPVGTTFSITRIHLDPGNALKAYAASATKLYATDNLLDIRDYYPIITSFDLSPPYPNPYVRSHDNTLTIQFSLPQHQQFISITMIDVLGRVVYTQTLTDNDDGMNTINIDRSVLSKIHEGFYLITIKTDEGMKSQKVLVR